LGLQVFSELLFPCVLLVNRPVVFLRDTIPYSAEALMIHEIGNKNFPETILDLFSSCSPDFPRLLDKDLFRCPSCQLSSNIATIFGLNLIETIG
jgi:hypothetical protein